MTLMNFMFEITDKEGQFTFGGPLLRLSLAVSKPKIVQVHKYSQQEQRWSDELGDSVSVSYVFSNGGPNHIRIVRTEFAAWRDENLVEVRSVTYWRDQQNELPAGTMLTDTLHIAEELPDRIVGQVTVELSSQAVSVE